MASENDDRKMAKELMTKIKSMSDKDVLRLLPLLWQQDPSSNHAPFVVSARGTDYTAYGWVDIGTRYRVMVIEKK